MLCQICCYLQDWTECLIIVGVFIICSIVPILISLLNLHDQYLIFRLCLCAGGGAEAGGYFSAEEAGLIFRHHCRPFLVPQAAVKVVLVEGWQFWTTLGSDWEGMVWHPVPSTEHLPPWWGRGVKNSKKTFSTYVLVKALSGLCLCLQIRSKGLYTRTNFFPTP